MRPGDAVLLPAGVCDVRVTAWRGAQAREQADWLADEVPVALVFNGISHAVMLASPADLDDFALGFGITEGLLADAGELYGVETCETPAGIELHLTVAAACEWRLRQRRRNLAGRTGCGLCGTDSLGQVRRELPRAPARRLAPQALARAQRELRLSQGVQQLTGATHAAAWCALDGAVALVREDIGRHNALDKLVGALIRAGTAVADGFICITSRASFEMVQKTALAGVGALAAVSAPTALAVETARQCGVALAGFVRGDDLVVYTYPERFGFQGDATGAFGTRPDDGH
ncbi:MAG: formate dehydrogenase accessory sulfurtransferase FdhD [Burkholderiales bacterium]|nr:formate dehydrogenase accessory sulfurtransferase FdhD [Burkholderiales bacterium]